MKNPRKMRFAHADSVNSVFIDFDASVVISVDDDSIRLWDPVNGRELFQADAGDSEDAVIPGLGSIYLLREVSVN